MEQLIEKLKSIKRYEVVPYYDGVRKEEDENGDYVKWEDLESIINNYQ